MSMLVGPLAGCVAGAAVDGDAIRSEAQAYPRFVAQGVQVLVQPARSLPRPPFAAQIFHSQARHLLVAEGLATRLDDCEIRVDALPQHQGRRIQVRCPAGAAQALIDERLPAAFYMGDLQVARLGDGPTAPWALRARARATTGLYWLGLYQHDGLPLFKAAIPHANLVLAEVEANSLALVGTTGRRTVIRWP